MRRGSLLAALAVAFTASSTLRAQPSIVILVRHAEKAATPANDPVLSPEGVQRSLDLAAALSGARVSSVVTTQLQRTQLTAKPISDALGKAPIVVPVASPVSAHIEAVAAAVRTQPAGSVVLVVGHSNTIPAIVAALGGPKLPDLCDPQYSVMFVLEYP
ncbi:MAG TPA: histidine phosphatase family protein, partial [Gemmatimonadaceae bacterium]